MCGSCCSHQNRNKVIPGQADEIEVKKYGRVNGWTCPPHPLQLIGWLFLMIFGVTHFAILVFYLPLDWIPAGIIVPAGGFVIHLTYHILALTLDPADPAVRRKGIFEKERFDRSKQGHVIENSFCYICQTKVSSSSKHCSVCNKCIFEFDHHCKWLNNCVGGRNYKLFLGSCISAFGTALIMFIMDLYLLCVYYTDRQGVLRRSGLKTWRLFVPVCKEAYIIFDIVNGLLLLIALVLLGHLLIFHGYLICNKMSTYDYILQARQKQSVKSGNSDLESNGEPDLPPKALDPLTSAHTGLNGDVHEKRSYEMHSMDVYAGPNDEGISNASSHNSHMSYEYSTRNLPGSIDEVTARPSSSYSAYESPLDIISSGESFERKKKRKYKQRTSSQMQLLEHEYGEESDSLPHGESFQSIRSHNSDLNRLYNKEEMLLEDFTGPVVTPTTLMSRPTRLTEEKTGENILEFARNESIVSRPRSPLPRESVQQYYLNQTDYNIGDTTGGMWLPTKEESVASNKSSVVTLHSIKNQAGFGNDTEDSGIGKNDEINSPTYSAQSPFVSPISNQIEIESDHSPKHSIGSQLSLSNALNPSGSSDRTVNLVETIPDEKASNSSLINSNVNYHVIDNDENVVNLSSDPGKEHLTATIHYDPTHDKETSTVSGKDVDCNGVDEVGNAIFEDNFFTTNEQGGGILQPNNNASYSSNDENNPALVNGFKNYDTDISECNGIDGGVQEKPKSYVDVFKLRKESTQYSFGSDSDLSVPEVPLALLDEEADTSTLKESLDRVRKLSDAFPSADELEKFKKSSLTHPRFMSTESMAELSVVEYSRKKKLKKRGGHDGEMKELPPLRGARLLSGLTEEK